MLYVTDVFLIIASIFLGLVTVFFCIAAFYWIKILRDFSKASSNLRDIGLTLKEKIEGISGLLAGIIAFIEKMTEAYFKKKRAKKKGKGRKKD